MSLYAHPFMSKVNKYKSVMQWEGLRVGRQETWVRVPPLLTMTDPALKKVTSHL